MGHTPRTHTSLDAVTAAANGASHGMRGEAHINVELRYTYTGANPPTAVEVVLEQRIGSNEWTALGNAMTNLPTVSGGDSLTYNFAKGYYGEIRLRNVTMTGGTAVALTGTITEAAA